MVRFIRQTPEDKINIPLLEPLYQDLMDCEALIDANDSQFARRTFIRACFAFLEANTFYYKDKALAGLINSIKHGDEIPIHKIALLTDKIGRSDETGKLKLERGSMSLSASIAFVYRSLAEIWNYDAEKLFSDNGWNALKKAIKVRNRITHPKAVEDLTITDEDMDEIREGLTWIFNSIQIMLIKKIELMTPGENALYVEAHDEKEEGDEEE